VRSCSWALLVICASAACSGARGSNEVGRAPEQPEAPSGAPVGLALDIDDGRSAPLSLRAGQRYYINQIDVRASSTSTVDEGVSGLAKKGDFSGLSWEGIKHEETEPGFVPDLDGTFSRTKMFRGAAWMKDDSKITVAQVDEQGSPTAPPIELMTGQDGAPRPTDDFFIRRMRALQWTLGCAAPGRCEGANRFEEEALIELRNALHPDKTFQIDPRTRALRVKWSKQSGEGWTVPVQPVTSLPYAYGFSIDVTPLTPPSAAGHYLPGQDITFRITFRDGAGKRLHPEGSLPTYAETLEGPTESGLDYYGGFTDRAMVYWRHQHRERMAMVEIVGPAENVRPLATPLPLEEMFAKDVNDVGLPARDGFFAAWKIFPATNYVFGGAVDPKHEAWGKPGSDTWTFHLPNDAAPGTYYVTAKGRRAYHGEEMPFSRVIPIQVGTATPTTATLTTGKCESCHAGKTSLASVLHANDNRATCAGCHAPLSIEYNVPIPVRVHYIHSRSKRVEADTKQCSLCHLEPRSIEKATKAACLSCHLSYPEDHVQSFGPLVTTFTGGWDGAFDACATKCHTSHPGSGF